MVYSGIDPKDGDDDDHQNDNDKIGSFLFNFVCFVGLRSSEGDRLLETERRVVLSKYRCPSHGDDDDVADMTMMMMVLIMNRLVLLF